MHTDLIVLVLGVCAGGAALLAAIGVVGWMHRAGDAGPLDESVDEPAEPLTDARAEAGELARYATDAAARAERATIEAEAARERYAAAEAERARIEAEYDAARDAYAQALRAVQAGRAGAPTPDEEQRDRQVTKAALAAYRRKELSVDQLRSVFSRSGQWDPAQLDREREAERRSVEESRVRRAYDRAVAGVIRASDGLHVAEVAATAYTQEAVDAAVEAQLAAER
jgi:hypothetical protein